jgi:hypothetical protein
MEMKNKQPLKQANDIGNAVKRYGLVVVNSLPLMVVSAVVTGICIGIGIVSAI